MSDATHDPDADDQTEYLDDQLEKAWRTASRPAIRRR